MVHEFYLPLPEAQVLQAFRDVDSLNLVKAPLESVTSIVVTGPDTIIHYDHWEDGYETDINNPTQPTTQIWGDGNDANGIPPGYASDPIGLPMGAVIPLRNNVNLPRNPSQILYDGRDRITASKALAVSRALWPVSVGTVLSEAVEVTATIDHGTHYIAPVGEDVDAFEMFEQVGLTVMADQDNTVVTIDKDGPGGAAPTTVTLNQGESHYVSGGVLKGAEVTATKPVQVHLLTGDTGATYETRWYTLFPVEDWFSRYVTPIGSSANGQACFVFLYNPGPETITIEAASRIGTESITVPAGEVYRWQVPQNSGAMFSSAGDEPFSAIAAAGAHPNANSAYDWGFSLVPQDALSSTAVVGWGPGSSDMTRNGSPVFVSPAKATRIYVDYNGDGQGPLTDPNGGRYDAHYDLDALQSQTLFDPDGDQTAMRIYTIDGALFSAAWGQDPDTARPGNPYLDMGSTVLPLPEPKLAKTARIVNDVDPAGPSLGDTIEYRIVIDNKGLLPLGNTLVLDTLPTQLDYVADSTTLDGEPMPDDTAGNTLFPLDEDGYTIPVILRAGTSIFTYQTTIVGTGSIVNRSAVPQYEIYDETGADVPPPAGSHPCTVAFVDAGGNPVTVYREGAPIYLWFKDLDANRNTNAVETITLIIRNETTGDYEAITLTETGLDTGIFTTTTPIPSSPSSGLGPEDGTLYARAGDTLTVGYVDPLYGDSCSDTATVSVPSETKVLYLTDSDDDGVPEPPSAVQYRRQITFDNATRNEALTNFPVLVHLTGADFDFTKTKCDGRDIRFFDADGVTPLSHEIESWDIATQQAYIWVKVPQIDAASSTDSIWMHYGNPALADAQNPAAVWSDGFSAVWHMDETSGTMVSDSTGNGWDGTASANVVRNADGMVNGADEYPDGLNNHTLIKSGAMASLTSGFTFESWIHVGATADYDRIFTHNAANHQFQVVWGQNKLQVARNDGTYSYPRLTAATSAARGSWHHFVWVFDGTSDHLYINGAPVVNEAPTSSGTANGQNSYNYIAARDANNKHFKGKLDEMRLATVVRSAAWVDAQYAAMTGSFAGLGAEESVPLEINFAGGGVTNDAMDRIDPVAAGDTTTAHTVILDCTCEWGYRKQLSFRNASRAEDLDNFPVLVHLTSANFDFAKAQNAGQDIRFFDADGTTALAYEIESWDAAAKEAYVWVRVPRIDASSSTDSIWMEYGNPEAADAQQPAAVWSSGFEAVWHMDETSGTTVADSTGNGWNATASANVVRNAAGQVNGADEYPDGATSYAKITKPGEIVPVTSGFTYETWVRVGESVNYDRLFTQDGDYRHLQVLWSTGRVEVARNDGSANYGITKAAAPVPTGEWFHFAWVFDGTNDNLYVDGVPASTTTTFGSTYIGDGYNYIGALTASKHNFNGRLDETRIASAVRSAAWINAQHASMADSLIEYGAEQPIPSKHVTSVSFTQAPVFCKDFAMTAGGDLAAIVYAAVVKGAMPHNPVISATLKHGTTQFADLGTPTATFVGTGTGGEAIYRLDWSAVLGGKVTVPAGQAVTLGITTDAGTPFSVLYDSADYPSRVSLPAETIIDVQSLALYDAPYPGGSPVGAVVAGSTVYVRVTVSDPFGAYDITSLDLAIPEAGVDVTLDDGDVVASTPCSKTYEYAWTPTAEGSYAVTVTANEGTEGITDVAATRLDVTFLDFGTPSITEFTIDNNGAATNIYDPDQTVFIRVTDLDQNTNPGVAETITVTVTTSTGDTETITLTETGFNTGVFTAAVPASSTTGGADGDGTLYAPPGTVLDVVYVDQFDPTDTSSDTAIVTQPPGSPDTPALSVQKQLADPAATTVASGDFVVYRIRVSNTGNVALDPVTLTDTYPSQLQFISASPAADSHDGTQRKVIWNNVGPLAVGGTRNFELTFKALAATPQAVNTATASSGGVSDSDTAAVEIVQNGHTVTKTLISSKNPASYGDIVEYRIVVANTGTTRITTLPLEDTFSAAYLEYVPGTASIEPDGIGAGTLFWENIAGVGGLAAGDSITIDHLKFRVVGAGSPVVNTAAADFSEDEHGRSVPPARDDDDTLVTIAGLISGHVWNDLNKNAAGDAGEPRLEGVEIRLFDAASNLVATATTVGTNGFYEFPNLPDGTYTVVETDPPGFGSTGDAQGANDNQIVVTVANGSVHTDQDFFDYRLPLNEQASISGTVWNDANRNGAVDSGEKGIKGVTVVLYEDVNGDGVLDAGDRAVRQTQTDVNGCYAFTGLPAGSYIVVENDLPGYISTGDVDGLNDNQISVSVNAGGKVTGRDFFDAKTQRLYGYAYQDADLSLTRNTGDGSVSGMVVQVWQNGVQVAVTNTDSNGFYQIQNLVPGTYEVRFICNTNALTAIPAAGSGAADDIQRNRAVAAGSNYASVTYDLYAGHGIGADRGEPVNAGFTDTSPTSSGVDLQAYRGADGVYVEFVAYDVEGDGYMTLYLIGPDGWPIWEGTTEVTASPRQVCRFRVPDHLVGVGGTYAFVVRDEVGKIWRAPAVTVKPFAAEMIRMSLVGVTLAFDSLPDREYEIQWTRRLGTPWQTVTNVPSQGKRTTVVVPHPDSTSPSGFFRIVVQ